MENSPASQETIVLTPEAQQLYDAGLAYLDTAEAPYQPDDEEDNCEVREHTTSFEGESSFHARVYKGHPRTLFRMSGEDASGNWVSIGIDSSGDVTPVDAELEDETVDAHQVLRELFDNALLQEQARAAEKAEARIAEAPRFGELTPLSQEESQAILEKYIDQEDGNDILRGVLITDDILPVASQQLSETTKAHYSRVYNDNGRFATVAYIETEAGIIPQYYYLSSTQVAWRLLPGLEVSGQDDEKRVWYDKADSEHALTLPAPMQKALASMSEEWHFIDRDAADEIKREINTSGKTVIGAKYQDKLELLQDPYFHGSLKSNNIRPEETVISGEHAALAPNYTEVLDAWEQVTPTHSNSVRIEIVPSHDGTVHYMYITDNEGRVWLGGADDVTAPVRPNGLRQGYIDLGAAAKPAMEKRNQAGAFGVEVTKYGPVDVYQKFLSRVPLIKDYVDSRSLR